MPWNCVTRQSDFIRLTIGLMLWRIWGRRFYLLIWMSMWSARLFPAKKLNWELRIRIWTVLRYAFLIKRRSWWRNSIIRFFVRKIIGRRTRCSLSSPRKWELTSCVLFLIFVPSGIVKVSLTWPASKCWRAVCRGNSMKWRPWTLKPGTLYPTQR